MPPKKKIVEAEPSFFSKRNWSWLIAGGAVIIAGFVALSMGSITLAPILLVLGYCVLIPIGILIGPPKRQAAIQPNAGEPAEE